MPFIVGLILLLATFFQSNSYALGQSQCPEIVERNEGTQIQQTWSEGSQTCFFSITPLDGYVDLIYRDYLFTSEGLLMVFNSYGKGPDAETTGARMFYLFPRPQSQFSYSWNFDTKELEVRHITGDTFIFDSRKARLKSMSRGTITNADDVNKENRGGVEIMNYKGLLLDSGFEMGRAPNSNRNATSVLKDSAGKQCKLKNYELFNYLSGGDVVFKFKDGGFGSFLKKRCPSLAPGF